MDSPFLIGTRWKAPGLFFQPFAQGPPDLLAHADQFGIFIEEQHLLIGDTVAAGLWLDHENREGFGEIFRSIGDGVICDEFGIVPDVKTIERFVIFVFIFDLVDLFPLRFNFGPESLVKLVDIRFRQAAAFAREIGIAGLQLGLVNVVIILVVEDAQGGRDLLGLSESRCANSWIRVPVRSWALAESNRSISSVHLFMSDSVWATIAKIPSSPSLKT